MCNFFSLISSGDGRVYYFSPAQRIARVTDRYGIPYEYDSHSSIACYFLGNGKEDECNKWEYDPFTDYLVFDQQNTANDVKAVAVETAKIDFTPIAGDVIGFRKFVENLQNIKWLDGHDPIPENVRMCETRNEAWSESVPCIVERSRLDYALDNAFDVMRKSMRDDAWRLAWQVLHHAAWKLACNIEGDETSEVARDIVTLITNQALVHYVCAGLISQQDIDIFDERWKIWMAGYGVLGEANGILYCYKKP